MPKQYDPASSYLLTLGYFLGLTIEISICDHCKSCL